jgi:macrodomain Ter protein organizer (MatP/YcbG family)
MSFQTTKDQNTIRIVRLRCFDKIRWRKKKIEVEIQTWSKLKELIKSKELSKLLTSLINLFKDLIEKKLSLKVNWTKIVKVN